MDPFGNDLPLWAGLEAFLWDDTGLVQTGEAFCSSWDESRAPLAPNVEPGHEGPQQSYLASLWTHDFPSSL
jgi:hypothetical protein